MRIRKNVVKYIVINTKTKNILFVNNKTKYFLIKKRLAAK